MVSRRRKPSGGRQFAVIGLGRFGSSLAKTLHKMGYEVLAIDQDEEVIQDLANEVTHAVQADATVETAMRSLGIRNVDVAVVSVGDLQPSILATLILKDLGIPYIVCKAVSEVHGKVLEKLGADKVVFPERDMGNRLAHNLVSGNLIDYIELAPGYSLVEVLVREDFVGRTLKSIDLRAKYGINVVAIKRDHDVMVAPGADFVLATGDILVAIGPDQKLDKLEE